MSYDCLGFDFDAGVDFTSSALVTFVRLTDTLARIACVYSVITDRIATGNYTDI